MEVSVDKYRPTSMSSEEQVPYPSSNISLPGLTFKENGAP